MDRKKRRNRIITLMIIMALALTVGFAACGGESGKIELQTPTNIRMDGTLLTWDKVENADGYMVSVDGVEKLTSKNRYDLSILSLPDTYGVQVMALGDGNKYADSGWSKVKEYVVEGPEFTFNEQMNGYIVTGIGTITSDEIDVPDAYKGLPVYGIGYRAFENNEKITKVTLPFYLHVISTYAFSGCKSLKTVEISHSGKLRYISGYAFAGCTALESIELPYGLNFIGTEAFASSGLKAFNPPDSVTLLGSDVVSNCVNLESYRISSRLAIAPLRMFHNNPKLKTVTIPDNFGNIPSYMFVGSSIEYITIPKNIQRIDSSAFENTKIRSVEFEEGSALTEIKESAFKGCSNLESFVIPANVKTIRKSAFRGCSKLKSLVIPSKVSTIEDDAFSDCANLKNVTFEKGSELWYLNRIFVNTPITELTVKSVSGIKSDAFSNSSTLKTIRFENDNKLSTLYSRAFFNCSNLTTVDFGENSKLISIGESVFENCSNLTEIKLPSTVLLIYEKAFAGCTAMNSIIIPKGVKKMGGGVFSGWGKNQTIYIENLTEKPSDWSDNWLDGCNANIVWGYQPT